MELLKFSDSPKSTRRGKNPAAFIGAGIMVAVMGLSSTLAGTISINSGATVEFGQGIVSTAACDGTITVTPASTYDYASDTFTVSSIVLSDLGWDSSTTQNNNDFGRGCRDQVLELRAYDASGSLLDFRTDTASTNVLTVYIPNESTTATGFKVGLYGAAQNGSLTDVVRNVTPQVAREGSFVNVLANATGASAMTVTVSGLKVSSAVVRLTLESRAFRAGSDEKS